MELVIVERTFETTEEGQEVFSGDTSCFDLYQVSWARGTFSGSGGI